ncbi:TonB-dependent receptor [uncultured Photobacterium sp.]|uniref:TonB-dependent receptor n=1 Tax=uncultured Photobacterium sp. TaxID=173973 RepID=UPI00261DF2F6|nr:TonB-dependent receptor [uncultured Photobacterium sp.]
MKKTLLAVALAPLCFQPNAFAAETAPDETMVVIGRSVNVNSIEDIPANVTVIDQDEIQATGASDLASLLRGRAGIQLSDTNSGPVFSLRGFAGEQAAHNTLILIDGRRLNKADLSAPRLNAIALSQIERVEILSGSAGVLYGDQAVGGVINIITKAPQKPGGSIGATVGSFDTYGYRGDVYGPINYDWRYYLAANQINSDNYRDHNTSEDGSIIGRLEFSQDDKRFFAEVSYFDSYREYAGSLTKEQFEDNPKQANAGSLQDYNHEITTAYRVGYRQGFIESWDVNAELTYDDTDANGFQSGKNSKDSEHLFTAFQLEGALPAANGDVNILIGVDFSNKEFDYLSSFIDRDNEQQTISAYTQVHYPVLNDLIVTAGGRYSEVEDRLRDKVAYPAPSNLKENAHALELALNYYINDEHRVYARVNENFRFAKVDEQAFTPPDVIGLKPQTGNSIETGWSYAGIELTTNLNFYRLDLEDEIVFDSSAQAPEGAFFPQGANINSDATRRYGVDVSSYWDASDFVSLGVEYHYIDAEFVKGSNKGKDISWVAPHTGRVFGTLTFLRDWQVFAESVYTGSKYKDGDNANNHSRLEAYWLVNVALNYMFNDWRASLRVDNLADESYPSSANQWDAYYSGDGRKVTLAVDYQF